MTMKCKAIEARMPELLLEPAAAPAELLAHLDACASCRAQITDLRSTMALLDDWSAPEPNPYFMTRLQARLDEERRSPASWLERLRLRFSYGSGPGVRPLASMAMTLVLLVGGGAFISLTDQNQVAPPVSAQAVVISDLETLDSNAQLLDELELIVDDDADYSDQ